jgi:hypothetical protein
MQEKRRGRWQIRQTCAVGAAALPVGDPLPAHRAAAGTPRAAVIVLFAVLAVRGAAAAVTPSPPSVSLFPTQSSGTITLSMSFGAPTWSGTSTVNFTRAGGPLPAWLTTVPNPVTFSFIAGATSATTTFRFQTSGAAVPGTYTINLAVVGGPPPPGIGGGTMTVQIQQPSFTATASPNPVTLAWGATRDVSVATTSDPGLSTAITYSFSGFPAGISWGTAQTVNSPYPAATFSFAVAAGTAPGTYVGTLTGSLAFGGTKTYPMTVIVQPPDVTASFTQPALTVCNGGPPATDGIALAPVNGYAGTPQLAFTGVPAGITVNPPTPVASPMPPGQTVPFTVSASGAPAGVHVLSLRVFDPTATIDKTITLTVTVTGPDFTPALTPPTVTVAPGGPSQTLTASLIPNACFSAPTVVATPSGAPAGVTFSPPSATLAGPGYAPATFTVQAGAATTPGTYPITVSFQPSTGAAKILPASLVVVAAPDFTLAAIPPTLTVAFGGTGSLTISATALNGFADTISVVAPALAGVTFAPATFTLTPGASRSVSVTAASAAVPGTYTVQFTGTSTAVSGTRQATVVLTVSPGPPVIHTVTPSSIAAGTANSVLRLQGENFRPGATASSSTPGVTVVQTTVISGTLADVSVTARADAHPGPYRLDLTNLDGTTTSQGVLVLVFPTTSLGAPLGVTTAAIVFPRPFTLIAPDQPVFPRGLLATTGLGTITGVWKYDGVPFDRFIVNAAGGMPVEVTSNLPIPITSAGEHRLELAVEHPQALVTAPVSVIQAIETRSRLEIYAPEDGAALGDEPPLFRWSLVPGASGYEVEIERQDTEQPIRVRLSESAWRPETRDLEAIGPGAHRFRVRAIFPGEVPGEPTPWRRFAILPKHAALTPIRDPTGARAAVRWDGRSPGLAHRVEFLRLGESEPFASALAMRSGYELQEGAAPATTGETQQRNWQFSILGTGTETNAEGDIHGDAARLQTTGQADAAGGALQAKFTGDLGGRHDLEPPHQTVAESKNWQLHLGAAQTGFKEEARVGYSPPDFLDQSEFLAAGLARGGAQGKLGTPVGSLSYYETFEAQPAGATGVPALPQDISAVGFEAPWDPTRYLLRVVALRTDVTAGADFNGVEGEAVGVLGRFFLSPGLTLLFEGARGRLSPRTGGGATSPSGDAFRLGALGAVGRFSYVLNLRKTDAEFANPANLGLTPGAVPDRIGGDLALNAQLGTAVLSLQLRRLQSGSESGEHGPKAVEDGAVVTVSAPLAAAVTLSASGTFIGVDADADPVHYLPAVSRTQRGGMLTLTEIPGRIALSEIFSWQEMRDDAYPGGNQTTKTATLSANGPLGPAVTLAGLVSGTRTEAPAPVGRMDQLMVSLQPTILWPKLWLTVVPRAAYIEARNDISAMTSTTEQFQLLVQLSPPWARSLLNFQVAGDWNRSWTNLQTPKPGFQRRIVGTFTLRFGAQRQTAPSLPVTPASAVDGLDRLRPIVAGARL